MVGQAIEALLDAVKDEDGSGSTRTGADAAVAELASTRWARPLCTALVLRLQREFSFPQGGLLALLSELAAPQDEAAFMEWLAEQERCVASPDENTAIPAALGLMNLAFHGKAKPTDGLSEALLRNLSAPPALAIASAWALDWLWKGGARATTELPHRFPG